MMSLHHFSKEHLKITDGQTRAGLKITFIGLFVNVILVVLKLIVGIVGRSRALIADGVHSFADFLTDVITSLGIYLGNIPADECHHYGHKKIETVSEAIMGAVLICVGGGLSFDAGRAIYYNDLTMPHGITILVALASFMVKEILYHATIKVGRQAGSNVIIANAWHHRSDALSSLAVLIGLLVVYFVPSVKFIDTLLGFVVGALIIGIGWRLAWDAL
ncbi:MAG: cation transporter, partial [Candidatus Omnitrophica bacterium]|nr:cation transporter [Candidatus Omnitrophota bacterium]